MMEHQELAKDNVLVLVPMRSGQRLQKKDMCYPSHSFISLQQLGLIGRPQLLSCLYAACGCDENKMIGSSQNKCSECQEVTKALGSYVSRKTLEIVTGNSIRCRGGRNASVSVSSVQVSSNESWSEQIQLRNGMVVSISTNFENKRGQDDNVQLSFEVVSVPTAPRDCETSPREGRENVTTSKRPLEQSAVALQPCKLPKSSNPNQTKHKPNECHMPSLRHRTSVPLPTPPSSNASREQNEAKESNPCWPNANNNTNLAVASSIDVTSTRPIMNQTNNADSNVELKTANKRDIQQAVEPTLKEIAHRTDKHLTSISYGSSTFAVTELQVANPVSDTFNPPSDKFQPRLFFCSLGQDMSKGLIKTLSSSVEKLGGIVVETLEASTYMIVSSSVSSWEKVAKRLGTEEKELRSLLSSKDIKAITPSWIRSMAAEGALRKPIPSETWMLVTTVRAEKKTEK
mmetsp:Transcript_38999/g.94301  ORF Transcript_38999/g.94301 Transcript_38999/m.94301 type:complete len:458 (-) Transcript_38999:1374-2747(-)